MKKDPAYEETLKSAMTTFNSGAFDRRLARLVARRTETRTPEACRAYLAEEITPWLQGLGYTAQIYPNPVDGGNPLLVARRIEHPDFPTILTYAHGDVFDGMDKDWSPGLSPWQMTVKDGNYYGRGTADNKGQHVVNLMAIEAVLSQRPLLGFNSTMLFEMGEETGSPGLREFCAANRELLKADVLISSDGPRLSKDKPLLYLGSRGFLTLKFDLTLDRGLVHTGNWGGAAIDPNIRMVNALSLLVDGRGAFRIPAFRPTSLTPEIKAALAKLDLSEIEKDAAPGWGEPDLTLAERLFGWNSLVILGLDHGKNGRSIANESHAVCRLSYVPGTDVKQLVEDIRQHFSANGFADIKVSGSQGSYPATRSDPDNAWVKAVSAAMEKAAGKPAELLPNLAGNLPNDAFADILGIPATIWIPHSYAGCRQHAPDEHLPAAIAEEGLKIMTGLFYDLGKDGATPPRFSVPIPAVP